MDDMSGEPDKPAPDSSGEPDKLAPDSTPEELARDFTVIETSVVVEDREAHQAARRAGWAAHNWPWVLGLGIVAVIFGLVVLSHAFGSLSALLWLTGLFLLFMGIAQLMTLGRGGRRGAHLLGAAISIIGGLILLVWPGETLRGVATIAGITVLIWGLARLFTALREKRDGRTWDLIAGGALIVLGIIMVVWPNATITLVGVFVGLVAIAWGVLTVMSAFNLRRLGRQWEELHARSHSAG
jgi:uncharacterized membrane protein HdeD (DUF308 family)